MYKSFRIRQLRAIRDLEFADLRRVNLLAGKNGVGKTTVLEAAWMHHGADVPNLPFRADIFRGIGGPYQQEFMSNVFHWFDSSQSVELSSTGDWGSGRRTLRISLRDRGTSQTELVESKGPEATPRLPSTTTTAESDKEIVFDYRDENDRAYTSAAWLQVAAISPGVVGEGFVSRQQKLSGRSSAIFHPARVPRPQGEAAARLRQLEMSKSQGDLVDLLRHLDSRLENIRALPLGNDQAAVFADIGRDRLIPFSLMGDGLNRLLGIALAIAVAPQGLVLIDEIENGLHHSALIDVWTGIAALARRFNVQVIATTHSRECIAAAHYAFAKSDTYDFRLYRLERSEAGAVKSVDYDQETLEVALDSELEVR